MNELDEKLRDELMTSAETFAPATDFEAVLARARQARQNRTALRLVVVAAVVMVAGAVGWSTAPHWLLGGSAPVLATPSPVPTASQSVRPSVSPGTKESVTFGSADGLGAPVKQLKVTAERLSTPDSYQLNFVVTATDGKVQRVRPEPSGDERAALGGSGPLLVALIPGRIDDIYWSDRQYGAANRIKPEKVAMRYLPQVDATVAVAMADVNVDAAAMGCVWIGTEGTGHDCSNGAVASVGITLSTSGRTGTLIWDKALGLDVMTVSDGGRLGGVEPASEPNWTTLGSGGVLTTMVVLPRGASLLDQSFEGDGVEWGTGSFEDRQVILASSKEPSYIRSVFSQVTYRAADGREATWKAPS
ncbi:hypothetical protein ATK74_3027 [Propionicimonas paludicola]|uniref:Uncharacterized protein n=1 Tax=Propionicimonas paludicola TaxID=185243 RepID=A0A2A9CVK2_9ACTN|nr:hypothetical protein [Propionicimonas paludicola]PFG18438.1 hypothetical protein ATK74_3027 [Propionicimonas paludicola]